MRAAAHFLLLLATCMLLICGYYSKITSFSVAEVPDAFSSFGPLLWFVLPVLGITLTAFSTKNSWTEVFGCILLWSLFYIIPVIVNYPLLGLNIEQLAFAKSGIGNQGWPAAYLSWSVAMRVLNLDVRTGTIILGLYISITSCIILLALSKKVMKGPGYAYITTLLFVLPQTYYFNYFSDYSYAFPLLLMVLYIMLSTENALKLMHSIPIMFMIISTSLVLANPVTSMFVFLFIVIYAFTRLFSKPQKLTNYTIIYTVLQASWYTYYHTAFSAVSPWIKAISQLQMMEKAFSIRSYARLLTIPKMLLYEILMYYRYTIFALLGLLALYSLYLHIKEKNWERIAFYLSLLAVCALLWFVLTASVPENFSSRFMIFGTVPVALMASYALLALRAKLKVMTLIVLSLTLPLSFALSFSPSLFNLCSHEWSFSAAEFIAIHIEDDTLLISDTWGTRYIQVFDPNIACATYLDSVTVVNAAPKDVYLPQSRHLVLLSFSQRKQALVSFGRSLDDWKYLYKKLENSHGLIYSNHYSSAWLKL